MRNKLLVLGSYFFSSWLFAAQLHVSGEANLSVVADSVYFSVSVAHTDSSAALAKNQVDTQMQALLTALKSSLSKKDELNASQLQITQDYSYEDRRREFLGYRASRELRIELSDLVRLPRVLDVVSKQKIDSLSGLNYGTSKADEYLVQVRDMAISDSYKKAEQLAKGYKGKLGAVIDIRYHSATPVQPRSMNQAKTALSEVVAYSYEGARVNFSDRVEVSFDVITD